MSITHVKAPTSRLHFGYARCDITPPVGIYHRMWGAARHDQATGVHRALQADIVIAEPLGGDASQRMVRVQLDFVLLDNDQTARLVAPIALSANVTPDQVIVTHSHSHSAGFFPANRYTMPGGDLIAPFLAEVNAKVAAAAAEAVATLADATVTYATAQCDMAANRDYWDDDKQIYTTGFNPGHAAENTAVVGRVTTDDGSLRLLLVNYACHPTTLAWDNTLISPDYPGAMRDTIEAVTGAPCLFLQGASGELGPVEGFVGDTTVAERNGRQLAHAALSALEALPAAGTRFEYAGPVVSGATLGEWKHTDLPADITEANADWQLHRQKINLPIRPGTPTTEQVTAELAEWETQDIPDARAMAERKRRMLHRLSQLPPGDEFQLETIVLKIGGAVWVIIQGEPYSILQTSLRERFPDTPLVIASIASHWGASYLPPRELYGQGIYQETIAVTAPGSLETVIEMVGEKIESSLQ